MKKTLIDLGGIILFYLILIFGVIILNNRFTELNKNINAGLIVSTHWHKYFFSLKYHFDSEKRNIMEITSIDKIKKAYSFSNENLTAYQNIIDFKGKNVLSVVGSGDQYFSFLLFGAKEIDLFDNNLMALYYFYLKYYAIILLNYKDFIDSFYYYKNTQKNYSKIRDCLPDEIKTFFDEVLKNKGLNSLLYKPISLSIHTDNVDRTIPYLKGKRYYELKELLKSTPFPNLFLHDLRDLYASLDRNYDIMIFSNIYAYLNMEVKAYRQFLKKYEKFLNDGGVIEANYEWISFERDFKKYGFKKHYVDSANDKIMALNDKDNIITLKKHF